MRGDWPPTFEVAYSNLEPWAGEILVGLFVFCIQQLWLSLEMLSDFWHSIPIPQLNSSHIFCQSIHSWWHWDIGGGDCIQNSHDTWWLKKRGDQSECSAHRRLRAAQRREQRLWYSNLVSHVSRFGRWWFEGLRELQDAAIVVKECELHHPLLLLAILRMYKYIYR